MIRPPPRWRAALARLLPPDHRDVLLDELDALHEQIGAKEGPEAASRRYRVEALHLLWWSFRERIDEVWKGMETGMKEFTRQVRFAARRLRRAPGFTLVAVATLGLGIAASALIVGIVDRALLRSLPFPEPERLVAVLDGWGASRGAIEILQEDMTTLESLGGAVNASGMTLERDGDVPQRVSVAVVSPEYLEALGVVPFLGRRFSPEESQPGRGRVVMLAHDFWRTEFGADPDLESQTLTLDGERYQVVGVLPPGFDHPTARNDLWRPVTMDASNPGLHWGAGNHTLIGRMASGVTPERVREDLLRAQERVRLANPLWTPNPDFWSEARVTPLQEAKTGSTRTPLLLLLGSVGVLLLVVCANVANLFLSRGLAMSRDGAVRAALGAGRARLAGEQFMEVMLVTGGGLLLGLALSKIGLMAIRPLLPADIPGAGLLGLDVRVILITTCVAGFAAILAGTFPALRMAGLSPGSALREAGRGGTVSRGRRRTSRWLVGAQLSAAVVLVTSAGLLARTVFELSRVDPGFDTAGIVTAEVFLPPGLPDDKEARAAYFDGLAEGLEAQAALRGVAFATTIPFGGEDEYVATVIDGVTLDPNDLPVIPQHSVSAGFFETAGIPVIEGRAFDKSDRMGSPLVAVVDETFVRRFLPDGRAVGRVVRFPWRGAPPIEIVGVVGATYHSDLSAPPEPTVWYPLSQMGFGVVDNATVIARAVGGEEAGLAALQSGVREVDNRIAVSDLTPWARLVGDSLAASRLMALVLAIFAGATLLLGGIGVYGIASYSVRARLREIGVRMAVGAPTSDIRRRVLGEGAMLAVPGGLVGMLLAIPAARALSGVLYGVAPVDPLVFAATPLLLGAAVVVAVFLPARRATRVDPATVLRGDSAS